MIFWPPLLSDYNSQSKVYLGWCSEDQIGQIGKLTLESTVGDSSQKIM